MCITSVPLSVSAKETSDLQQGLRGGATIEISAKSNSGVEIPAYYDKKANKYYLFMFESDSRQLPVTYVGTDGKKVTVNISFASSDEVVLKNTQAGAVTVVFKQSKIPSLSITLNGTTLDEIHADKNVKYAGNSVLIDDAAGGNSLAATNVEIKGRGNSSWTEFDKKGYQIKFDKKTSVLGMEKAKKWVLIPSASDDSLLKNRLAFLLAQKLGMENSLECRFVDLWIDGDYRGNYLISEKVEIGSNRVDLTDDDGILLEWDAGFYEEENWFENSALDTKFAIKETVNEDSAHIDQLKKKVNSELTEFANYLLKTPVEQVSIAKLREYIDVDSFVQYYLVNEYLRNVESITSSWFWYKDGSSDVFHIGPVWDFDSSFNFYDYLPYYHVYSRNIFQTMLQVPELREYISNAYSANLAIFNSLPSVARTEANCIAESAAMNYVRWDVLGKTSNKLNYKFQDTWKEAVDVTVSWLQTRQKEFSIPTLSEQMYRLYNPRSGEHLYTSDTVEQKYLTSNGWNYENIGWIAPTLGTPVYRLYNPRSGDHHYTVDENEYSYLGLNGWNQEGVGWYSDTNERVPVFRQYNPNASIGTHNYTKDKVENDYLASNGWDAEGIGWYGL